MSARFAVKLLCCENSLKCNNVITTEARETIKPNLESLVFLKYFNACLTKF
jgi:hypothetical protein